MSMARRASKLRPDAVGAEVGDLRRVADDEGDLDGDAVIVGVVRGVAGGGARVGDVGDVGHAVDEA